MDIGAAGRPARSGQPDASGPESGAATNGSSRRDIGPDHPGRARVVFLGAAAVSHDAELLIISVAIIVFLAVFLRA